MLWGQWWPNCPRTLLQPHHPPGPDSRGQTSNLDPSRDPRTSLDLKEGTLTVADATPSPLESILLLFL